MAAGAQGKFFEFDHMVLTRQREISGMLQAKAQELGKAGEERSPEIQREVFIDLAGSLSLDTAKVREELESGAWRARVQREAGEAARLGVTGTPASFINGRYLRGAKPYESFEAEVKKEIAWAANGNRPEFAKGTSIAQLRSQQSSKPKSPDPNKVYTLEAGDSPYVGESGAKVTILHYLDYQ